MKKYAMTVSALMGLLAGFVPTFKIYHDKMKKEKELDNKNDAILRIFTLWFKDKQSGKSLVDFFSENGYKNIAIYGMHYLGECLLEELKNSEINVKYVIDRNAERVNTDIEICTLEDNLSKVDAIIVTAFYYFDEIKMELCKKMDCPIISLEDIIYEI